MHKEQQRLRVHHLLCIPLFRGAGYSDGFSKNMAEKIAWLKAHPEEEVELVCRYMQNHLTEEISLKQMCRAVGLSKSTLMRKFGKSKGLTPYRYLESIRINEGKKLLEEGVFPAQAAACTGFYDQSHFTNFFRSFIGLAPGAYRNMVLEGREKKHRKDEKDRGEGRGGKQGNGTQSK